MDVVVTSQISALAGLERVNLREQAAIALRQAITSGSIEPGTHLRETELSARLNISRGTLREAFRELQQEGLVIAGLRGRLVVRSLSPKEIRDIFVVRGALESLAARLIVQSEDLPVLIKSLNKAVSRMEALENSEIEERIEADLAFHRRLCSLADNDSLLTSWRGLEGAIRMSIMFGGVERGIHNMGIGRHRAIVDAIASGDFVEADRAIAAHMEHAAANLVS